MGNWQGDDLMEVPLPDDLSDCNTQQRRRYIYERLMDEGHQSLLDKNNLSKKLDVSLRQIYYDLDAVAEYVEETAGTHHVGRNMSVFEKAKREALREGDWKAATEILEKEAEWLENRGAIDKEPEKQEITWREYMERGSEDE